MGLARHVTRSNTQSPPLLPPHPTSPNELRRRLWYILPTYQASSLLLSTAVKDLRRLLVFPHLIIVAWQIFAHHIAISASRQTSRPEIGSQIALRSAKSAVAFVNARKALRRKLLRPIGRGHPAARPGRTPARHSCSSVARIFRLTRSRRPSFAVHSDGLPTVVTLACSRSGLSLASIRSSQRPRSPRFLP